MRSLAALLLIGHLEMRLLLEHRLEATGLMDPGDVTRVVDAIELLASRERRLRIRRR